MIKSYDIRDALALSIKRAAPLKVYFNQVQDTNCDYAWVQLRAKRTDEGYNYSRRAIGVTIQVALNPDEFAKVDATRLYDIIDAFDRIFSGGLWIKDRHINIYDTSAHIFDQILTYDFEMSFADAVYSTETLNEKMEELEWQI